MPSRRQSSAMVTSLRRPPRTMRIFSSAEYCLERQEMMSARPGRILVRDRAALERLAGVSYGLPEAEYRRLIR